MFNVRLASDHMSGKSLSTWLSPAMSMVVSYFVLFSLRDVWDEILDN